MDKDRKLLKTRPFDIYLTEKQWLDTQKITFLHPAKVVSYAILRPPPLDCTMLNGQSSLPIIICLHGAGLEADSAQVRSMLDAAHGTCAWVLFPSGVTSWSGDDWREFLEKTIFISVFSLPFSVDWLPVLYRPGLLLSPLHLHLVLNGSIHSPASRHLGDCRRQSCHSGNFQLDRKYWLAWPGGLVERLDCHRTFKWWYVMGA